MGPIRLVLLTAAVTLAATACATDVQDDRGSGQVTAPTALGPLAGGTPLPEAELPELDGEGSLRLPDDLTGDPAVLNFWATWCAFCVEEMPDLEEVHQQLEGEVTFVGVDVEDKAEDARTLAERTGVTYQLVADDDRSYYHAVQVRGMPTTVLVDTEGTIVYRHTGPLDAPQLRRLLREHLDVDVPTPEAAP